jgi:hypothetical protein
VAVEQELEVELDGGSAPVAPRQHLVLLGANVNSCGH